MFSIAFPLTTTVLEKNPDKRKLNRIGQQVFPGPERFHSQDTLPQLLVQRKAPFFRYDFLIFQFGKLQDISGQGGKLPAAVQNPRSMFSLRFIFRISSR